jgi:hypothetical protein
VAPFREEGIALTFPSGPAFTSSEDAEVDMEMYTSAYLQAQQVCQVFQRGLKEEIWKVWKVRKEMKREDRSC